MKQSHAKKLARVIEAAKWANYCPSAGGYRDGRSVEDCYEELGEAVNAYFGVDIDARTIEWVSEEELDAMLKPAAKPQS